MQYINEVIYDETVHGPNSDRDIVAGDWRDPDAVLDVRECRIVQLDAANESSPIVVQDADGEHIDVEGWLRQQVGRVLVLPIIARDFQRHNA